MGFLIENMDICLLIVLFFMQLFAIALMVVYTKDVASGTEITSFPSYRRSIYAFAWISVSLLVVLWFFIEWNAVIVLFLCIFGGAWLILGIVMFVIFRKAIHKEKKIEVLKMMRFCLIFMTFCSAFAWLLNV